MKVAFFIGSLNRGGTETLLLDICRRHQTAPFEGIVLYRNEGDLSEEYRNTGIPLVRIKPGRQKIGYIFKLRRQLKEEKIDILHTQTLLNAMFGIFCVAFLKVKLVASFHGFRYSWLNRFFTQLVMWKADASIFVSNYLKEWNLKNTFLSPRQRCYVVYNGIDFSKLDVPYGIPDFLKNSGNDSLDNVKLAMVGNFRNGRSQRFLCRSLHRLIEAGYINFQFYFIGKRVEAEPELFDDCVNYCKEHQMMDQVHFVGSRGDVPAILQHIDGFVYSSDHDTFGIAVVEAIASGRPTLVNDWVVMREIVGDKGWAEMYRTNDEEDSCTKMKELIDNIESRKQKAEVYKKEIREFYSIEANINHLSSIYSSLFITNNRWNLCHY